MAERITYLIIGNGIAGITAAEILRTEDSAASIGVVADDPFPVYYRPALKDYLAGRVAEDKLWARPTDFYQAHQILFLPQRVVSVQADQHIVHLQNQKQIGYEKLLLASGASSGRLACPGMNLQGVFTLRTVADYQAVLERLKLVRRVVVTGSGTLALETVETLRKRDLQVTHLVRKQTLWSEVLDATASDLVLQQEQRDGVDVHLDEEIAEISGLRNEVNAVVTSKNTRIACEMVLVAIGIQPNIDFLHNSKVACWKGVRVDNQMRTNASDIYAAGDIVETNDAQTGRSRVIGQWYPAIQQARAAAYSMLGQLDNERPFRMSTFYNASFLYGLDFASVGITNVRGYQELIAEPKPRTYRKVLLKDGVPAGLLALGDRRQALAIKRAIDHSVNLQPIASRLFADNFKLDDWLDKQGVPPPLLGVKRSGDTVVRQAVSIETNQALDQSMEGTMLTSQQAEGLLIQTNEAGVRLPETVLSRSTPTIIGRQAGVHLLVDEASVSRRHGEINYINGHFILRDSGSSNGTFLNEERIEAGRAYVLKPNDQIRIGNIVTFKFLLRTLRSNGATKKTSETRGNGNRSEPRIVESNLVVQKQPVLNPDGSLQPPGRTKAVPAEVVATFKEIPALIILPPGDNKETGAVPQVHLLEVGKHVRIGREKDNDIALTDVVVSRRHAEILSGPTGFYIRDLGSSNGVSINKTKITNPYKLSHGDQITMGSTSIFFVDLQAGHEQTLRMDKVPPIRSERPEQQPARDKAEPIRGGSTQTKQTARLAATGQLQVIICQRCGVANMRVARFCASCSALLGE